MAGQYIEQQKQLLEEKQREFEREISRYNEQLLKLAQERAQFEVSIIIDSNDI